MNITESQTRSLLYEEGVPYVEKIAFAMMAIILNALCDDPDECAGDNGGKDKTQIAKQI